MANETCTIGYDKAKVKENAGTFKNQHRKLEHSLNELTSTLAEHVKSLNKHSIAMENLNQVMKQLDTTIKKEIRLESDQPSMQLKEAITSFVEYNINPWYYRDRENLKQRRLQSVSCTPRPGIQPYHKNRSAGT